MRKTLWLTLIWLIVCVFAFSACDNGDTPSNNDNVNGNNQQTTEGNEDNNSGSENNNSDTPVVCQHTFGSWSTVKQATCKEEGKLVRTCSKCSETEESTVSKIDTHTEVVDAAVSATCTVDGKTEGKHCSVCGITIVEQTTVKASGHTEVVDPAVSATCTIEGKTAGKHCSVCDTVTVTQTSLGFAAHNYKNGACTVCLTVDTVAKNAEISAENIRHNAKVKEIQDAYDWLVEINEERILALKEQYNISYVYDNLTCYQNISDLETDISDLAQRIFRLESYNDPSDLSTIVSLKNQKQAKEAEKAKYEAMISIHRYEDAILSHTDTYESDMLKENTLYENTIEAIEQKYRCYEQKHNICIIPEKAPACEENGLTEGLYCEDCERYYIERDVILTEGHKIDESTGRCSVCDVDLAEIGFIFEWIDVLNGYQLIEYLGNDTEVVIPSKYKGKDVIAIATGAFNNCTHVLSIVVPESVWIINGSAFSGCSALQSITLPFVGYGPVENGDKYLTSTPPSSLSFGYVFGKNSYNGSVAVSSYGDTFYIPATLKSVTITSGNIFLMAFYDYDTIEYITLGENVHKIGASAFFDVSSLREINISSSVIDIHMGAFGSCNSLISINVDENNPNYKSSDGNLYSKDGKTLIKYADGKTEAIFTIPNDVTTIGSDAFIMTKNLVSITIPNSVTSIGKYAFQGCDKLVEIINKSSITFTKGSSDNGYVAKSALVIHNGESKITNVNDYLFYTHDGTNYLLGYVGNNTALTLPNGYNGEKYEIYHHAFFERADITSIIIPNTVTSIGERAFCVCAGLTSITISDSVTTIGAVAFFKCSSLTSIYYGGSTSQWTTISNGSDWDDTSTGTCTVYCTNGELKK